MWRKLQYWVSYQTFRFIETSIYRYIDTSENWYIDKSKYRKISINRNSKISKYRNIDMYIERVFLSIPSSTPRVFLCCDLNQKLRCYHISNSVSITRNRCFICRYGIESPISFDTWTCSIPEHEVKKTLTFFSRFLRRLFIYRFDHFTEVFTHLEMSKPLLLGAPQWSETIGSGRPGAMTRFSVDEGLSMSVIN